MKRAVTSMDWSPKVRNILFSFEF